MAKYERDHVICGKILRAISQSADSIRYDEFIKNLHRKCEAILMIAKNI